MAKKASKKTKKKEALLDGIKTDLNDGSFFKGAILRPAILTVSFLGFVASVFLFLGGDLRWGGSLVIFSFVLTLYSIYESLTDKAGKYRNYNLGFKLALFIGEVLVFNWVLTAILY